MRYSVRTLLSQIESPTWEERFYPWLAMVTSIAVIVLLAVAVAGLVWAMKSKD